MNNLVLMPSLAIDYPPFYPIPKTTKIKAEVVFGRPSKDCAGHGICRVEASNKAVPLQNVGNCTSSFAFIQQDNAKQICFYFLNSSLCIKARKKHFRKETFKVHESFMLPYGISQSFGMKQNFIIESGFYPIFRTNKYSIVVFSQ